MLLINPPVFKPCEPPAALAALSGFLESAARKVTVMDANIEAFDYIVFGFGDMALRCGDVDTWTRRALKNKARNWAALKDIATYRVFDKYSRAVNDINRALNYLTQGRLSLSSFSDPELSALKSADLLASAREFERNIFYPYFSSRLVGLFEQEAFDYVGLSLNYLDQALCAFAIAGFIRSRFPNVKLVLGGGLLTSWASQPEWENHFSEIFDYVLAGPGETGLFSVSGLLPEQSGSMNSKGNISYSFKTFELGKYLSPGAILPLAASSGCYWNRCRFCPERAEGNKFVPVPAELFVKQARALCAQYRPAMVHFLDNALSAVLLKEIVKRGGVGADWYGFVRFERPFEDIEFCRALKSAGCRMLKLGLESGSQDVLDEMDKGFKLDSASRILKNLADVGIETYVYLLFGTPAETREDALKTLDFTVAHADAIGFLNLAVFNLPVFADIDGAENRKEFSKADLSLYHDFTHPGGWDRKAVRNFLDKEFKRQPEIARILRREPPFFTSNHAAFFSRGD